MANVRISKNSLGRFSTSLLHYACDEEFIFTSLKRIASQSYIELKSERIATPVWIVVLLWETTKWMAKSTSCTPTAHQTTNPSARLTCSIGAVLETYGYENVTSKVNAGCFKLYDAYSTSFNSSNVCKLFWSWIQF